MLARIPDPQPGQQTICLLPWLRLDAEVSFGKMKIAPFAAIHGQLEDETRTTASAIAATFHDRRGNPVEPSICWFADRHPTSLLSDEDTEVLREHIFLGALAAITANDYLSHRPQINASHFQRIHPVSHSPGQPPQQAHGRCEGGPARRVREPRVPQACRRPRPSRRQTGLRAMQ